MTHFDVLASLALVVESLCNVESLKKYSVAESAVECAPCTHEGRIGLLSRSPAHADKHALTTTVMRCADQ